MKVRIISFIHNLVKNFIFEKVLLFLIKYSKLSLLFKLIPPNLLYKNNSRRICKRNGIKYSLDISDYQQWLIYWYSDADSSSGILDLINSRNDVIIDVGANIGQTSLQLAKKLNNFGHVYAFEPYPTTFDILKSNLGLNPELATKISDFNLGLGAIKSQNKMYQECKTNSGGNRIINTNTTSDSSGEVEITITTMDDFFEINHPLNSKIDLVKVDIEGYEYEWLLGAEKTLSKYKPTLFIELDDNNLKQQNSSALLLVVKLKEFGYTIFDDRIDISNQVDFDNCHFDISCFYNKK